ncbi:MAG: hypothetical protein NTW09_05675 [Candidatus Omnitrophica bacterium]|nr:hypothetical protein [Candidatus Omnitrophota bacterium]
MLVQKDYEELLRLFNKHKVRYCLVGAYAIAFYGIPRFTKDMDILIEPAVDNAKRILKALNDFGFKSVKLKEADFNKSGKVIQLGYEPIRIDLLTSIDGCDFAGVWRHKVSGVYGKEKIFFINKADLIKNKNATGRKQDKFDADILKKSKG